MTHSYEDIIRLHNQHTSYGADVAMQHETYSKLCDAMPDAVGLLKLYKQPLDRAIMGLEYYADDCRYNTTTTITPQSITTHEPAILRDLGNTANETLADIRKQLGDTNGG